MSVFHSLNIIAIFKLGVIASFVLYCIVGSGTVEGRKRPRTQNKKHKNKT